MRALVMVMLVACSQGAAPAGAPSGRPAHTANLPADAATDAPAIAPADARVAVPPRDATTCPATFAAASALDECTDVDLRCRYPEGECYCGDTPHCGGAAPQPQKGPPSFQCTPVPPAIRDDGCPGRGPTTGARCGKAGRTCSYDECECFAIFTCGTTGWSQPERRCKK